MSNPDVEELKRYNLQAKQRECRHDVGPGHHFPRYCRLCGKELSVEDGLRAVYDWNYFHVKWTPGS